jgi:hypothetical protein
MSDENGTTDSQYNSSQNPTTLEDVSLGTRLSDMFYSLMVPMTYEGGFLPLSTKDGIFNTAIDLLTGVGTLVVISDLNPSDPIGVNLFKIGAFMGARVVISKLYNKHRTR